jgi:hypothetical protein
LHCACSNDAAPEAVVDASDSLTHLAIPAWMGVNICGAGDAGEVLPSRRSPTPKSPLSERSPGKPGGHVPTAEHGPATSFAVSRPEQRFAGTPSQARAVADAPDTAAAPPAPLCNSPGAGSQARSRWDTDGVHVHVDALAMRRFLAEWKGRGLVGEPPAGLRIMSQCAPQRTRRDTMPVQLL